MRIWQQRRHPRNRKTVQIVRPVANAEHVVVIVITAANAAKVVVNRHPVKTMARQRKLHRQLKLQ